MAIEKTLTDINTDVPMIYHVVLIAAPNWINRTTVVTVASYYSKDTYKRGGKPLNQDQMLLPGVPEQGDDLIVWVQNEMVKTANDEPADTNQFVNRFLLSGGSIVDQEPHATAPAVETPAATQEAAQAQAADAQQATQK